MLGWALNEEDSIGLYIERAEAFLQQHADDFELVLIDDGSTDETVARAREYQRSRPWLRIYSNDRNCGSGYNTRRAIALAQKSYLFWQTVDWAYDIEQLGRSFHLLRTYDVLQGVRVNAHGLRELFAKRSDTSYKALVSIVNYWLIRMLFHLPVHDYQNVTVYPTKLIQSVKLESESAFTNPECLLKCWWKGASIKEVPVPFLKRERGTGKGTRPRVVLATIADIVCWWWRWRSSGQIPKRGKGSVEAWNAS
jgi:glycosyltransferase involved in cell wall biosynthesis